MLSFLIIGFDVEVGLPCCLGPFQAFVLGPVSVLISVEQNCKVNDAHVATHCSPPFLPSVLVSALKSSP